MPERTQRHLILCACLGAALCCAPVSVATADAEKSLLPVACSAHLGISQAFSGTSWALGDTRPATLIVEPSELQVLSKEQYRIKMRAPRLGLRLVEEGADALLKSRAHPARIRAGRLMKFALRINAGRLAATQMRDVMMRSAIEILVARINAEIGTFGYEIVEVDLTPASFQIWERSCAEN